MKQLLTIVRSSEVTVSDFVFVFFVKIFWKQKLCLYRYNLMRITFSLELVYFLNKTDNMSKDNFE